LSVCHYAETCATINKCRGAGTVDTADVEQRGPAVQIARRAGITEQTLYRWRDEFISAGKQGLNGRGAEALQGKEIARLSAQLAEREQVIGELTIAKGVLKKLWGSCP